MTMSPFCILEVLKSATKISKLGLQIRYLCQKIILDRVFSIVKMSVREVTIFPEKNLNGLFFIFKMHQTKTKLSCMHS